MAMLTRKTPSSPKAIQRLQNCIANFIWPALTGINHQPQKQTIQCKSTQLTAIDCFTNDLVERKTKQWEQFRESYMKETKAVDEEGKSNATTATTSFAQNVHLISKGVVSDLKAIASPQLGLDIRSLSQAQLDNLLLATLEVKNKLDFLYLIRQTIRWNQLPSNEVLIACLKYLSSLCRLQQIEALAEVCRNIQHPYAKVYSDFAPFKALCLWKSGGADIALFTLQRGYGQCSLTDEGKRMARIVFRTFAEETLGNKSEAVLIALMDVAKAIYKEHKDIFIVACVWKQCFLSQWASDQKIATDLFAEYEELQQIVAKKSSTLTSSFLAKYNIDAVHRLIEVFLQYQQRDACNNCLSLLFNYQYLRKDLRACAEIVKSCSELDMPLCERQNEQFLTLFLNQSDPKQQQQQQSQSQQPIKHFKYHF